MLDTESIINIFLSLNDPKDIINFAKVSQKHTVLFLNIKKIIEHYNTLVKYGYFAFAISFFNNSIMLRCVDHYYYNFDDKYIKFILESQKDRNESYFIIKYNDSSSYNFLKKYSCFTCYSLISLDDNIFNILYNLSEKIYISFNKENFNNKIKEYTNIDKNKIIIIV